MQIGSINSYNYTSFQGKYGSKKVTINGSKKGGKFASQKPAKTQLPSIKPITKQQGLAALAAAAVIALGIGVGAASNNNSKTKETNATTTPTYSYTETMETMPTEEEMIIATQAPVVHQPIVMPPTITAVPQSERNAVWYEVKRGDRLADIVKKYAELHEYTDDKELTPYYIILENDNPGKWNDRNKILIGTRFRVDGIFPQNIITIDNTQTPQATETTPIAEETQATEPAQLTSPEDTVTMNGIDFCFDLGTMKKHIRGDYSGLMFGKYVTVDKRFSGDAVFTEYEGTNKDSNIATITTYDEDGNIIQIDEYENGEIAKSTTYHIQD